MFGEAVDSKTHVVIFSNMICTMDDVRGDF